MSTKNKSPFSEGQKVVCVDDKNIIEGHPPIKEGEIYTVHCVSSATGDIKIKERPFSGPHRGYYGYFRERFAPINPSYSDATRSILEQFRKDEAVKDKCDSPVKEIINQ